MRWRATPRPRARVVEAYARYDYPTIFQTLNQFLTVDLSAFYADVSKDRLYTFGAASPERRSAQTAMYMIADGLARLLAPILPVTADDSGGTCRARARSRCTWPSSPAGRPRGDARRRSLERGGTCCSRCATAVNAALEVLREKKEIGTSLQASGRSMSATRPQPPCCSNATRRICRCSSSCRGRRSSRARRSAAAPRRPQPVQARRGNGRSTPLQRRARSARAAGGSCPRSRRPATASGCATAAWTR